MENLDVSRDPAVKLKGEDLAHAYDAVRVANKSVFFFFHVSRTSVLVCGAVICAFQVPGESAAWPALPAGGAAEVSAAAAQPGHLQLLCWCTDAGISCTDMDDVTYVRM